MSAPSANSWKYLAITWVAFFAFHAALMAIDWNLRDQSSEIHPLPGGIPDRVGAFLGWSSIAAFGIGTIYFLPSTWPWWIKIPLGLLQTAIAVGIMVLASIWYISTYGIDTF
jgi:hypothetical protein